MVAVGIVSSTGLLIASARAEDAGPRSGSPRAAAAALSAHGTRPRGHPRADGTVAAWRVAADGATVDVIRTCDFHGPADGVAPSASLSRSVPHGERVASRQRTTRPVCFKVTVAGRRARHIHACVPAPRADLSTNVTFLCVTDLPHSGLQADSRGEHTAQEPGLTTAAVYVSQNSAHVRAISRHADAHRARCSRNNSVQAHAALPASHLRRDQAVSHPPLQSTCER